MTAQQLTIDDLFAEVLRRRPGAERSAFLDAACAGDADKRKRVERLLAAHARADRFLESPAADPLIAADNPPTEQPGTMIGAYKLMEQIGEGGMGVVFMAEQEQPMRRKVALKIIKPGMDTREVIGRFEAERQALAMMDHPNIAKVFDAGTTDDVRQPFQADTSQNQGADPRHRLSQAGKPDVHCGRPYFVMELVQGVPITEYCDQCQLTTRERLELFVAACQAVQHAHQKGIIHRDIKPTNVLVAMQDGHPAPKIIDFGVAKAIGQRLTDRTLTTGFAQMVGTPLYMSPEQAELSPLEVDTRSDVYSLGVLLYELLTGTTPFEKGRLSHASYDELRRILREEEPPWPSGLLSTIDAAGLSTVAERRRTDARKLSQLVRGDLDWIVMKALDKDRNRRYATVRGLARDLERFLNEEPVEARPPSTAYKFRKFLRRNRTLIVPAAALMVTLLAGIAGTTLGLIRATAANSEAGREAARALSAERLQQKRSEEALAEAAKATAMVELLRDMLIASGTARAKGRDYTVRELLDDFSTRLDSQRLPQPELEADVRGIIGNAYGALGLTSKAETQLKSALELRHAVFGGSHAKIIDSLLACAWNASARRRRAEAEALARSSLAIARDLGDQRLLVATHAPLQNFLNLQDKFAEADVIGRDALAIIERNNLNDELISRDVRLALAGSRLGVGKPAEAEQLAREALAISIRLRGEEHSETAVVQECLVSVLEDRGSFAEAEVVCRRVLATRRKHLGNDHPHVAGTLARVGELLLAQRDYAGAEATFLAAQRQAEQLAENEAAEPEYQHLLNTIRWGLASLYVAQGKGESALAIWSDAIDRKPENAANWFWRGELQRRCFHQWHQAIADYSQALQLDSGHAGARDKLAWILVTCPDVHIRDPLRAIDLAQDAVTRAPSESAYWNTLGVAYYRNGDWEAAGSALNEAVRLSATQDFSFNGYFLAMVHWRLGQEEEARRWYVRAVEWMKEHRPNDDRLHQFQAEADELMGQRATVPVTPNR